MRIIFIASVHMFAIMMITKIHSLFKTRKVFNLCGVITKGLMTKGCESLPNFIQKAIATSWIHEVASDTLTVG